jgi:HD-GYP domain-containing protein (c-di-GMP phosphodiesterase class II)
MIRFSKIIEKESKEAPKKRNYKKTDISLRKIGIFDQDGATEERPMVSDTVNEGDRYYKKLSKLADLVRYSIQKDEAINISAITPVMRAIVEKKLIDDIHHYLTFKSEDTDMLASHSIKVTVVSLKIGVGMNYDDNKLSDLATCALLQDVGMYEISSDIVNKQGTLTDYELKELQRHPQISADILSRLDENYRWPADVALQVHERADGSVYPFGLEKVEIHEYAYIIGLADMYADMTSHRRHGERIEPNAAIREILDTAQGAFPASVVKAFLSQISFFPLGAYVKLNDRSVGRVIDTNPDYPLKPAVEISYDSLGNKLPNPRAVDLSQQILLYITGSIDEGEIS